MDNMQQRRLEYCKKAADAIPDTGKRRWLVATINSYGSETNQTILHVCQGSPPRAFILEQPYCEFAILMDSHGKLVGTARGGWGRGTRWHPNRSWKPHG